MPTSGANKALFRLVITLTTLVLCGRLWAALPQLNAAYKSAHAWTTGDNLTVSTGRIERQWHWTGRGFVTTSVSNLHGKFQWNDAKPDADADWSFPSLTGSGKLISIHAQSGNDHGFTSKHLTVAAVIDYPQNNIGLRYVIWVFPHASGLRTQVQVRRLRAIAAKAAHVDDVHDNYASPGVVDRVPINLAGRMVRWIGYYADTQHRNMRGTPILREQRYAAARARGKVTWASVVAVHNHRGDGLIMVKESDKCVNTPHLGPNTGWFQWNQHGLVNTGTGWFLNSVHDQAYHHCWASWVITYQGNRLAMQLALKRFDRICFPIHPRQDEYIMANTWGASYAARGASLRNVLAEIKSQANLGIDVQEIDAGWGRGHNPRRLSWWPRYSDGWKTISAAAAKAKVRLGLWFEAKCPYKNLAWNYDHGGFRYFKIDFCDFPRMRDAAKVTGHIRRLILHSHHRLRVNWDVTERLPRIGYYYGRQYGNVYLENRQTQQPRNVIYVPYLVLRDTWQLAKYDNINEFQITTTDTRLVNRKLSDAWQYSNSYCFMQTIMGSPMIFTQTHLFSQATRQRLRRLIAIYKANRSAMFAGYVFPIGNLPNNATWSGFQNQDFRTHRGFITLFRQIGNHHVNQNIALDFVAGKTLTITNLLTHGIRIVHVPASGMVNFSIPNAPGFLYLSYRINSSQ